MNKTEDVPAEQFPHEAATTLAQEHNALVSKSSKVKFHPSPRPIQTSTMVKEAIKSQMTTPHRGVSLVAIKKFIWRNYQTGDIDIASRLRFIKSYIVRALNNGNLVRTRGSSGVSGSFRLPLKEQRVRRTMQKAKQKKKKRKVTIKKLKVIKKKIRSKIKNSLSSMRMRRQNSKKKTKKGRK